jgi:hypothetical protein
MFLSLQEQKHIGQCCTLQLQLFIRGATIVSLTVFAPRASSGTILELCSFRNSNFKKHKLDSAQNVTVSKDQMHIGQCCTLQLLLLIRCTTIVSMTVFAPRALSGTILELCSFRNSNFKKHKLDSAQNVPFFAGTKAHWTVLYITTSTLHTWCYNSVIDSFCSKSLKWDHTGVMLIQKFKF